MRGNDNSLVVVDVVDVEAVFVLVQAFQHVAEMHVERWVQDSQLCAFSICQRHTQVELVLFHADKCLVNKLFDGCFVWVPSSGVQRVEHRGVGIMCSIQVHVGKVHHFVHQTTIQPNNQTTRQPYNQTTRQPDNRVGNVEFGAMV